MESHLNSDWKDSVNSEKGLFVADFLKLVKHGKNNLFSQIKSIK